MTYLIQGDVTLSVGLKVKSDSEVKALKKAIELLNRYNVDMDDIIITNEDGDEVDLEVYDTYIEWDSVVEDVSTIE